MTGRCQTNVASYGDANGLYPEYVPCGAPAVADAVSWSRDWCVCEVHAADLADDAHIAIHRHDEED